MANLKHAFVGQTRDLVDPYVQVSFAGLTVSLDNFLSRSSSNSGASFFENVIRGMAEIKPGLN